MPVLLSLLCPTRANCSLPITKRLQTDKENHSIASFPAKPHYTLPLLLQQEFHPIILFPWTSLLTFASLFTVRSDIGQSCLPCALAIPYLSVSIDRDRVDRTE